jgi:hypothetical protein
MTEVTRLEKIADDYIKDYLLDHPINDFSLESDLEEYTENVPSFDKNEILQEYLKSGKSSTIEDEIHSKLDIDTDYMETLNTLIGDGKETLNKLLAGDEETHKFFTDDKGTLDTHLLINIKSVCSQNEFIGELMKLVIVNDKVIVRDMKELREAELDDPYSSDNWIYHEDWKLEDVINYVREENDMFRIEDESEEAMFGSRYGIEEGNR